MNNIKNSIIEYIKKLIDIDIYYSTKQEGKLLFKLNVPIIDGYIIIKIKLNAYVIFTGYIII